MKDNAKLGKCWGLFYCSIFHSHKKFTVGETRYFDIQQTLFFFEMSVTTRVPISPTFFPTKATHSFLVLTFCSYVVLYFFWRNAGLKILVKLTPYHTFLYFSLSFFNIIAPILSFFLSDYKFCNSITTKLTWNYYPKQGFTSD